MAPSPPDADPRDEFVRLFAAHAQRLYAVIFALVPNAADADDVFQETSKLLWERFGQFTLGTNFFAWACRIAQFQVLAFRQRKRRSRLWFSDDFLQAVTEQAAAEGTLLAAQQQALANCLQKLKARDRELVQLRYRPGMTTKALAERLGRSLDAIYKALNRTQDRLLACVQRTLLAEGFQ